MSLLEKLQKAGAVKSEVMTDSVLFNVKDSVQTSVPIINGAFSGMINGGFTTGLTILAGESKTFKTLLSLYCLRAYQKKYPDSVCLFYDCEFGTTPEYMKAQGIDPSRVIHIPLEHVEQMKFDMVKRLQDIKRGDRVFILVDSLGNLASKKEVEDAESEKSVADMSRAKAIRSFFRITTPHFTAKDIPCFIINHVYLEQGMFPKTVIPGGTAVTYAANNIFVITKAQEKQGTEIVGYKFTLNIHKSRFVREKAKFPFTVTYDGGINKWSGLLEVALELGHVTKPKNGWYTRIIPDKETGEVKEDKNWRAADTSCAEFWTPVLKETDFAKAFEARYRLALADMVSDDSEIEVDLEADDE
jgi:RecA/RadA recombinase